MLHIDRYLLQELQLHLKKYQYLHIKKIIGDKNQRNKI